MEKTVLVAMSGGVDSSVAAALLKEEGYNVIGITMQLLPKLENPDERMESCCGVRNIRDAQCIAADLQIPHYVLNLRTQFRYLVIDNFTSEYESGRTPNPCIRCNQFIKFGVLLNKADELDADYIATGHYARIIYEDDRNTYVLKKGIDDRKDQSYFLYVMTQSMLARTLMPLGNYRKNDVRKIARDRNLHISEKAESQEICFIDGKNYRNFFELHCPELLKPGPIVMEDERVVGTHSGIMCYTIGQRRGLGISSHVPLYVTGIDPKNNTVKVGYREKVYHSQLEANDLNWIEKHFTPANGIAIQAKIRSIHTPADAQLTTLNDKKVQVSFHKPQWAITPGQAVALYQGERVIGGGTIKKGW
jgi:tRNA-specific 2-thiouridylase